MTPEQLFNGAASAYFRRWAVIQSFQRVVHAGLPHAQRIVASQDAAFVASIDSDPELKEVFSRPLSAELGQQIASLMSANTVAVARASVDAAALVFAHAILDETASEFCRVSAAACPQDWESRVLDKKVSLKEVRTKGVEVVFREALEARLESLERESLPAKVQHLLACCQPPAGARPIEGYEFSIERLERIDRLRHQVVHESVLGRAIENAEADLEFLQKTGGFLLDLVARRYGLKIDPHQQVAEVFRTSSAPPSSP
jgi:hypothetical protein